MVTTTATIIEYRTGLLVSIKYDILKKIVGHINEKTYRNELKSSKIKNKLK